MFIIYSLVLLRKLMEQVFINNKLNKKRSANFKKASSLRFLIWCDSIEISIRYQTQTAVTATLLKHSFQRESSPFISDDESKTNLSFVDCLACRIICLLCVFVSPYISVLELCSTLAIILCYIRTILPIVRAAPLLCHLIGRNCKNMT